MYSDNMIWKKAKTYENIAPHEYIIKEQQPALFEHYKKLIEQYGKTEYFCLFYSKKPNKYYYEGEYKYFIIDNILNRTKISDTIYDKETDCYYSIVSYHISKNIQKKHKRNKT